MINANPKRRNPIKPCQKGQNCCGNKCKDHKKTMVQVCSSRSCAAFGSKRIMETLSKELEVEPGKSNDTYDLSFCGCLGYCSQSPNVLIGEDHIVFDAEVETITEKVKQGGTKLEERILDLDDDLNNDKKQLFDDFLE